MTSGSSSGPFVPDGRRRRVESRGNRRRRPFRRRPILFVTGGSGFVGRHLVGGSASAGWQIVAPSSRSLDLTRRERVIEEIGEWKPDAVVHLAYRKGDRQVIVEGSRNVADAARRARARLVHVSTDMVFAGGPRPFTERDEPQPIVDYGQDKFDAERAVAAADPGAAIVRTSLVYGTDRLSPAQIELRDQLRSAARRTAMTYFTDEYRCPVHAGDLAAALVEIAGRGEISGPLHVTGPELVSRYDLAMLFARQLGLERQASSIRTSTVAESGMRRPARIELDVALAARSGIRCRPVSEVLR